MKIQYDVEHECFCTTPCPYGYINGYEGSTKKVGSYACHDCKNFVSVDLEKREVECKADTIVTCK